MSRALCGKHEIEVLELCFNPQEQAKLWPSQATIPGLVSLKECIDPSAFRVVKLEDKLMISWKEQTILESVRLPRLIKVKLEELKGLKAREGDCLPPGFQSALCLSWKLEDTGLLYGLGQRSTPLEKRGTSASNWTTDEPSGHNRTTDPLYQAHPLLWGKIDKLWWAAFLPHSPYTRFDLGQDLYQEMNWLSLGSSLCLHVHAAESPQDLFRSLSQCWQPPSPPPLWALGFHQSRWGYKTGQEVLDLVGEFKRRELPLDVVHLDIDHMEGYRSFTFAKERFPQPKDLIDDIEQQGVKIVTIIDPGLRFDPCSGYEACDSGLKGDHFLKSSGGAPVVGYCWPDEALFPDFSRQATRSWWAEQAKFYLEQGVAGLWIDMNEPAIFDKPFWTGGHKQQPLPLNTPGGEDEARFCQASLHNLYGSQMAQATSETWAGSAKRPWVLTRSGFTGVGAYAWSWMGDNTSWWEHLKLSLPQLASMGLVGCPFVGVDIGGFFGHCTPELYSYWIEASVIYPFMRAHSALNTRQAHPWSFGEEIEGVAKTALSLRYRLLPYLYQSAMAAVKGEVPILRPMFFDFPDDPRFYQLEDQVMFGPHLMAAPFLNPGQSERLVVLPQGMWYELLSGKVYGPGSSIIVERTPGLTPLFARAGSAIALLSKNITQSRHAQGMEWSLLSFPGPQEVESQLYWDEGEGYEYQSGKYWEMKLKQKDGVPRVVSQKGSLSGPKLNLYLAEGSGRWTELGVLS